MHTKGVSPMDVKRSNKRNTFKEMLASEQLTHAELAERLELSSPTIVQNLKELADEGLVREAGRLASTGGRRPKVHAAVPDARVALGIEITKSRLTGVVVDLRGDIIHQVDRRLQFDHDAAWDVAFRTFVDELAATVDDRGKILGLGISLPGVLSTDREFLVYSEALKLADVPMRFLSNSVPYECSFMNDANAAALAEVNRSGEPLPALYLSLSDTVGGGLVYREALYRGSSNRAGEFGHMTLVPGGRLCYCGRMGCVDAYCSALVLSQYTGGDLAAFFDGLDKGDGRLHRVWKQYLDYLAIAVNNLYQAFDCPIIVGGYVGEYLATRMDELKWRLVQRSANPTDASYLKSCCITAGAPAAGAALSHVRRYIDSL